ncbi:hypothetical protein [Dyella telluris]|uniref:Uncharacterized protein n=1 Tax=Dyella telluris TaxID=2763498 RepID=A0A7G8Q8N8_9GAMM|nr:hypothetical protein [Dyella telluris]QNK03146.1 hypothetical protein H8F01_08575 [Dyella telluris]
MNRVHSHSFPSTTTDAAEARVSKAWARAGGALFALVTLISMAWSAEWKFSMMLFDPLVWMVLLVALAAGLVCGYAVGVRVHARAGH